MSERFFGLLLTASRKRTLLSQYKERIGILLRATSLWTEGYQNNAQIKRTLGISINTVKFWRKQWIDSYPNKKC